MRHPHVVGHGWRVAAAILMAAGPASASGHAPEWADPRGRIALEAVTEWSAVRMDDLRRVLQADGVAWGRRVRRRSGEAGRQDVSEVRHALAGGVQGEVALSRHFGVSGKVLWVRPEEMEVRAESRVPAGEGEVVLVHRQRAAVSMVPVMLGGWIESGPDEHGTRLRAFVQAGPAFATSRLVRSQSVSFTDGDFSSAVEHAASYSGTTVAGEVGAQFSFPFSRSVSLVFAGGYRLAKFMRMTLDRSLDFDADGTPELTAGESFTDSRGRPVGLDFSGFNGRLSLRIGLN